MKQSDGKLERRFFIIVVTAVCLLLTTNQDAKAQDTNGKFRLQPSLFVGGGTSDVDVGTTTSGDTVSISGGGGVGVGITFGYGLAPRADIMMSVGYQESNLSPDVANATGTFSRTFFLATALYRIPVSKRFQIKIGGGAGLYMPEELDIDTGSVAGGGHLIVKYDNAIGGHVFTEGELFITKSMSVNAGFKYYSVTYRAASATINGAALPAYILDDKIRDFDGSGLDLMLSFAKYF